MTTPPSPHLSPLIPHFQTNPCLARRIKNILIALLMSSQCLFAFEPLPTYGGSPAEAYDSLSHISSEELLANGRTHFEQRQPGKALACFTVVSERYRDDMTASEAELCIRAMNNCACVYKYFYFDYPRAYEYLSQASDLCEHLPSPPLQLKAIIMVNLGDLLSDYSMNYDSEPLMEQASELLEHSMEKAVSSKNWELLTTAFFNLANQNYTLNLSHPTFDTIFSPDIPEDTPDLHYVRLLYKGIKAIQQGDYKAARQHFTQQLDVVTTRWAPERDTLATYLSIAHTYTLDNNPTSALDYLSRALAITEHFPTPNTVQGDLQSQHPSPNTQQAGICQLISEAYANMGDQQQASHYHTRYLEIKEEINKHRLASIGELNYIHRLKKEEQKTRILDERQRQQQYVLLVSFIVIAIVAIMALLLWRKNRLLTMRNHSLFEKNKQALLAEDEEQRLRKAYSHSNLNDGQREMLISRIQEILNTPEIICQQDFTLAKLAKLAESNTTYVSQVINEKYAMTFSNVLGSYRAKEACRRLNDTEHYGNITIEAISASLGFKSRSTFVNTFKRETGFTPSEYQRLAKTENK